MRLFKKLWVLIGFAVLAAPAVSQAAANLTVVGAGMDLGNSKSGLLGTFSYGGGALLDIPTGAHWRLEFGGIYQQFTVAGITPWSVEVPLMFRMMATRVLSFGIGGYGAYQSALGSSTWDGGLKGGIGLNIPLSSRGFDFVIDANYLFGLTGTSQDRSIEGLVGLSFPL